jgi:hypothetical protein
VSLRDQIHGDLTAAMRSGDGARRDALRMLWNAIYGVEKREHTTLDDAATLAVVTRELKTRRESIEAFRGAGREDLATPEESAVVFISTYLPAQLTDAEVRGLIAQAISETGAASPRDLGKVMGWLSPRTKGKADGKIVSGLVAQALANRGGPMPAPTNLGVAAGPRPGGPTPGAADHSGGGGGPA